MKAFILRHFSLLRSNLVLSDTYKYTTWFFSLMISAYLLISLAIPLYESSTHPGYVFATDNDGGRAVETSMKTRWYNSNHFAPYGNLYYRFSQTVADLMPLHDHEGNLTSKEARGKSHVFALKIISLFSLYGLGLFVGWALFGFNFVIPLFGSFFTLMSLQMPMWIEWVFRPHPEHLLNVFIAIAVYMFARFWKDKENVRIFILSAFAWGIAVAVKRSTSIFIPGILLLLLLPLSKERLQLTLKYVGYMLLAYLAVGFPQNFGFYKHIKFLLYESSLHSIGDLSSITQNLKMVGEQLLYLIPIIVIAAIFSPQKKKIFSKQVLLLVLLAFVPILMRKMSFPGDHHTMPLAIGVMMVVLVFMLQYLPWRINSNLTLAALLLIGIKLVGITPQYFVWENNQTACFKEFDESMKIVNSRISAENKFIKEPFFPSRENIEPYSSAHWGIDWSKISSDVTFFGVTKYNIEKYSNERPKDFYGKMIENWDEKQRFYHDIKDKTVVRSPAGVEYQKVFTGTLCNQELWMAKSR